MLAAKFVCPGICFIANGNLVCALCYLVLLKAVVLARSRAKREINVPRQRCQTGYNHSDP